MYNIADEIKAIKPKYLNNDMLVFFDSNHIAFAPDNDLLVIKGASLSGADNNLIKFGDIDDINKAMVTKSKEAIEYYGVRSDVGSFMSFTLTKDVLSIFNAIATCGSSVANNVTIKCFGTRLVISAYSVDYNIYYDSPNYNTCDMNFMVSSTFNFAYYIYTLDKLYGNKDGLQLSISVSPSYAWIKCGEIMLVVRIVDPILPWVRVNSYVNVVSAKSSPVSSDKKTLTEKHGTRFKHLAKCFSDDVIKTWENDKVTLFISGDVAVVLGKNK